MKLSMCRSARGVLCSLLFIVHTAAFADDRNLELGPKPGERRVALVIGNAAYQGSSALKNPGNDARAIAEKMKAMGFDVILRIDSTQKDMNRAITRFGEKLSAGGVGLFYYAGHGMQVRGKNFLVPVDAEIEGESAVRSESVDLDLVLDQLSVARVGVVILDACRNNPFERRFRGGSGNGLAQVDAPKGVLIAYATAPGKVAADGSGKHGLYTSELLRALDEPGRRIEDVFKQVRIRVSGETSDRQIPWESSSLTGDFYFLPQVSGVTPRDTGRDVQPGVAVDPVLVELEMWKSVKDSTSIADFEEYIRHYPNGKFAGLAHARMARIGQASQEMRPQVTEADMVGKWKFGRATSGLLAPAGHLCDVELLAMKGAHGNAVRACHGNESFWRINGDTLEFLGNSGQVTTIFTLKSAGHWEGAYVGPASGLIGGVIHYLKRDAAQGYDGQWSGELETYGGLFESPVRLGLEVSVRKNQLSGHVFMYGENRTFSGQVAEDGELVDAKLTGSIQGYTLHGKLWDVNGEGLMGWKLRMKLSRKPMAQ